MEETEVLGVLDWLGMLVLLCIPLLGLLVFAYWAFAPKTKINKNRKNFSKAAVMMIGAFYLLSFGVDYLLNVL